MASERTAVRWSSYLCHPVPVGAVVLLAVNDHLLKGAGLLPGAVTGKLSDLAGLFFFPIALAALTQEGARLAGIHPRPWPLLHAALLLTGAVFAALKLWPAFNGLLAPLLGPNALDPTDLLALPSLGLCWHWLRRAEPPRAGEALRRAVLTAAAGASLATSVPQRRTFVAPSFPRWASEAPARRQLRCARADAWVARSGKEGAGVVLEVTAGPAGCAVRLAGAELRLPSRTVPVQGLPPGLELASGAARRVFLAFPFDGDAAWNAGERSALLVLELAAGEEAERWEIPLTEALDCGDLVKRVPNPDYHRGPGGPPPATGPCPAEGP